MPTFPADMLHATCEKEYREIRAFGLKQPVLILPNGVDLPPEIPRTSGERRKLLFLGRLHPVKGIENLLAAWRALAEDHPDWELHIVGPGEPAYTAGLKVRAARLPPGRIPRRSQGGYAERGIFRSGFVCSAVIYREFRDDRGRSSEL